MLEMCSNVREVDFLVFIVLELFYRHRRQRWAKSRKKFMVWFVEASNSCSGGDRLLPELAKLRRFVINDKKCFVFFFSQSKM